MSRRKAKEKTKPIVLNETAQQKVVSIVVELNRYLATARDILNVPDGWTTTHNENGIPTGFAPPKEEK